MQQRGLTLLEMMVVLLIAGMAVALGFQSLGQWRRANAAIFRPISEIELKEVLRVHSAPAMEKRLRGICLYERSSRIPRAESTYEGMFR